MVGTVFETAQMTTEAQRLPLIDAHPLFAVANHVGGKNGGRLASTIAMRATPALHCAQTNEVFVTQSLAHADLIASFKRAQADAAHKYALIRGLEKKGPRAIQAAVETAAKAAKRRDSYAKKLSALGVSFKD